MRLIRLHVENFAGIGSATVEFGPKLNILYGPNELGKSSLVEATRAALLLQHTSKCHESWIPWGTDRQPEVELTFESEPARVWRVRKTFGDKGKSILDESKDGINFAKFVEGRRVDAELRKLLRWGIAEKHNRNMPESFLTCVLLPRQEQVGRVFDTKLSEDDEGSGRAWLTQALDAVAANPVFKKILDAAQEQVDLVFTPTGKLGKKKSSPFVKIQEEINEVTRWVDDAQKRWQDSQGVQADIQQQNAELLIRTAEADEARRKLDTLRKAAEIQAELRKAQAECSRIEKLHEQLVELEVKQRTQSQKNAELDKSRGEAAAQVAQVAAQLDAARQSQRELESDAAEAERRIRRQSLENELLVLEAQATAGKTQTERAERAARELAGHSQQQKELAGVASDLARITAETQAQQNGLQELRSLAVWLDWKESSDQHQRALTRQQELAGWRTRLEALEKETKNLAGKLAERKYPAAKSLTALRKLAEDLRVAEARVDVGLLVEVKPLEAFELTIHSDDQAAQRKKLSTRMVKLEARAELRMVLGDLAQVVIRGGAAEARDAYDALKERWQNEGAPALAAAGVKDLIELDAAMAKDEVQRQKLRSLEQERDNLRTQIARETDPEAELRESAARRDERAKQLEGQDWDKLARRAEKLKGQTPAEWSRRAAQELAEGQAAGEAARLEIARLESRRESLHGAIQSAQPQQTEFAREFPEGCERALTAARAQFTQAESRRGAVALQLAELDRQASSAVQDSGKAVSEAEAALTQWQQRLGDREKACRQAADELSSSQGELKARRELVESSDLKGAQLRVVGFEGELKKLAGVPAEVTAELVQAESQRLAQMERSVQNLRETLANHRGALRKVAGESARDRLESLNDALKRKQEEELQLTREFDAWKLLRDALRTAEDSQAAHLGQALMEPVAKRLQTITHGKHQGLALGPELNTYGVKSAGDTRQVDRLSMGARDQLATLFRIALAEQLRCALMLDDQLAQSDEGRLGWFQQTLRDSVSQQGYQIIVMTCRPMDYLSAGEVPAQGQPFADGTSIRAVDLRQLVKPVV